MNKQKLKLGILLDSYLLPAWAFRSLERIVNLECANVSVLILNELKDSPRYEPDLYSSNHQNAAYRILSKIDKAIFHRGPDAFAPKDAQALFPIVPVMRVKPENSEEPGCFAPSDIAEIKSYKPDILIRMGFKDLSGDILTAARFGVWTYVFDDLSGFWEVMDHIPETSSMLCILNNGPTVGKILYRSQAQTYLLSPVRNRNRCFWLSSSFLPRQIQLLQRLGKRSFFTQIEKYNLELDEYDGKKHTVPSNINILRVYIQLLFRNIREFSFRALSLEYWYLLFDANSASLPHSFSGFKAILPPRDRYWTDPHIVQEGNNYFIFVEEFIYKDRKGQISVIGMDQNGAYQQPVQILSKNYHLSYPFVFKWNGQYFMIPETSENRTIELYECIQFPFEWKFRMNLMENIIAVDTTLYYGQGKWWLFTGIAENEGALPEIELFLFYSTELFTNEWIPHPLNPIVSDVKKARPAGKIITDDGKIFRPSQDCSRGYGWGFNINEILLLSETEYLEKDGLKVKPDWNNKIKGVHTFSQTGSLTVIDAYKRIGKIL